MSGQPVRWTPYDTDAPNPYPMFKRLRDEAPLYYNEEFDFWALSRYQDCENGLFDRETFSSAQGGVIDVIKARMVIPSGMFVFEDPPRHTIHRGLFARMFAPRRLKALEPQIRRFCREALDRVAGTGRFDFVADLGAHVPMQVIGMLLGIPEEDQQAVRARIDAKMVSPTRGPKEFTPERLKAKGFDDYLDWREKHPSDDIMTELLNLEFEDEHKVVRKLTRDEVLVVLNQLSTAGNETTNKLISWTGKVLADHPDQRRQLHEDRSLIPQAIEEILRFESPSTHVARVNTRDVELYGQVIPKNSIVAFVTHAANRDERRFENPDVFDIHRQRIPHLTFGYAWHACLGNPLARLEGRIALEEVLNSFPEWDIDHDHARLVRTGHVRGYETLPAVTH